MFLNEDDLLKMFVLICGICILIGVILTLGLPWIWDLIKPWIHEVTK